MKTLQVDLGDRAYPIYIGSGLLPLPDLIRPHLVVSYKKEARILRIWWAGNSQQPITQEVFSP